MKRKKVKRSGLKIALLFTLEVLLAVCFFLTGCWGPKTLHQGNIPAQELESYDTKGYVVLNNNVPEEARYDEMREQLSALRKVVTNEHVEAIREILTFGNFPLHYEIHDVTAGDFAKAGKQLQKAVTGTLLVSFPEESVLLLFSDGSFDCGQAVKEKASTFGAKGGGSATNARANFAAPDALQAYIGTLIG